MADAFRVACQNMFTPEYGDRPGALNILIVITDGKSTSLPPDTTLEAALDCRKKGIQVSAIGVGEDIDTNELSNVVSEPASGNFFQVQDFTALNTYLNQLLGSLCNG